MLNISANIKLNNSNLSTLLSKIEKETKLKTFLYHNAKQRYNGFTINADFFSAKPESFNNEVIKHNDSVKVYISQCLLIMTYVNNLLDFVDENLPKENILCKIKISPEQKYLSVVNVGEENIMFNKVFSGFITKDMNKMTIKIINNYVELRIKNINF